MGMFCMLIVEVITQIHIYVYIYGLLSKKKKKECNKNISLLETNWIKNETKILHDLWSYTLENNKVF